MQAAPRTAIVHLVRYSNGIRPFEAFMGAYERLDPGLEHELVLLFKGFPSARGTEPYRDRAAAGAGGCPASVHVSDRGVDLTAYLSAATTLHHERLCFLNSFSEPVHPGWLGLLDAALEDPGVGAAGSTGSWASDLSYHLFQLGFPTAYASALPGRVPARLAMHQVAGAAYHGPARHAARVLLNLLADPFWQSGFPAPHLRTNAFLVDRLLLLSLHTGDLGGKRAAYRLESGRRSMTAQLRARGRPPVVVGRDGRRYRWRDWPASETFWCAEQANLLVSDNQTRRYDSATEEQRAVMSSIAWGSQQRTRASSGQETGTAGEWSR